MIDKSIVEDMVFQIIKEMYPEINAPNENISAALNTDMEISELNSKYSERKPQIENPTDQESLLRMMTKTPARIGVGRAGGRLKTNTYLKLRADHAVARDSVFKGVNQSFIDGLGLFSVQTKCGDINEHLTRPDLGRQFSEDAIQKIKSGCMRNPQVQVYVCDGLSSSAVEANAKDILPSIFQGLQNYNITVGTPFFVKFGRVPAMDVVTECLGSEVTCVLIGERPGLATANSMSAYITYRGTVDMLEARRTVVSNIHSGGIGAVEAGAYIADIMKKMLDLKTSGVDLTL